MKTQKTFSNWCAENPSRFHEKNGDFRRVYCGPGEKEFSDLFALSDYLVSSVGSGVTILREK